MSLLERVKIENMLLGVKKRERAKPNISLIDLPGF